MNSDPIATIKGLIDGLQRELEQNPIYRQIQVLQETTRKLMECAPTASPTPVASESVVAPLTATLLTMEKPAAAATRPDEVKTATDVPAAAPPEKFVPELKGGVSDVGSLAATMQVERYMPGSKGADDYAVAVAAAPRAAVKLVDANYYS